METLILPHGFNPSTYSLPVWRHLVWGNPAKGLFGRHAKAAQIFLELYRGGIVPIVYFGNGKYRHDDGRSEAEYTFDFVRKRLKDLPGYSKEIVAAFADRSIIEPKGDQNTQAEAREAVRVCDELGLQRIITTTSPFHSVRSLRDVLMQVELSELSIAVEARPANTNPPQPDVRVRNVKVEEPR